MRKYLLSSLLLIAVLALPVLGYAQEGGFVRLVGLPFEQTGNQDINVFIEALYRLAIGVAATAAVLRLILAGAQYMLTEIVTQKSQAKKNVQSSLIGLLVVLSAVLVLNTINPELTNLEALNIRPIAVDITTRAETRSHVEVFCSENDGCVRQTCPLIRGLVTCRTWCENRDGVYVGNGIVTAAECVMSPQSEFQTQLGEELVAGNFGCTPGSFGEFAQEDWDCSAAIARCTAAGGTRYAESLNSIECFRQTTEAYQDTDSVRVSCQEIPGDGISGPLYNCSDARSQCTSRGEVVRGTYENYIECSG